MKNKKLAVVVSIGFVVILVFLGSFPNVTKNLFSFLSSNYLIITPDAWYSDSELSTFVSYKQSQGYNVELVRLSTVDSSFPPTNNYQPLQIHNLENMVSSTLCYLYYNESGTLTTMGTSDSGGYFVKGATPATFQSVMIYSEAYAPASVTLTYDGGQRLTFNINTVVCFGYQYVTTNGFVYLLKQDWYSLFQYIHSKNFGYVMLVGNTGVTTTVTRAGKVPGIPLQMGQTFTDYFYGVSSLENDFVMREGIVIARLPVYSSVELDSCLDRIMYYKPNISKTALSLQDKRLDELYNDVVQGLTAMYGTVNVVCHAPPTMRWGKTDVINDLGSGYDNAVIYTHGSPYAIETCMDTFTADDIASIQFRNPMVIVTIVCDTCGINARFAYVDKNFGETMMTNPNSKVVAYIGGSREVNGGDFEMPMEFYQNMAQNNVIGSAFKNVFCSLAISDIDRFSWTLYGEPTMDMMHDVAIPEYSAPLVLLVCLSTILLVALARKKKNSSVKQAVIFLS